MAGSPRYQVTIKQLVHKAFSPSITFLPTESSKTTNSHIKLIFPWFRQSNRSDWYTVALESINVITKGLPEEPIVIESESPYSSDDIDEDTLDDMGNDTEDDDEEINTEWIEGERLCYQYYEDQHNFDKSDTYTFVGECTEHEYVDVPLEANAKRKWIYANKLMDLRSICEIEKAIDLEYGTPNCFRQIQSIARVCTAIDPGNRENELDTAGLAMHKLIKQILEPGNFKYQVTGCKYAQVTTDRRGRHSLIGDILLEYMHQSCHTDRVYITFQVNIEDTIEQILCYHPHKKEWYIRKNIRDIGQYPYQAEKQELELFATWDIERTEVWNKFRDWFTPHWKELETIRDARLKKENYKGFAKVA